MNKNIDQKLINEENNQNNSLWKSIEILAEMTRADIERSNLYLDTNFKLDTQNQ